MRTSLTERMRHTMTNRATSGRLERLGEGPSSGLLAAEAWRARSSCSSASATDSRTARTPLLRATNRGLSRS
jgi:hypothetical protein